MPDRPTVSVSDGPPEPASCTSADDIGRLHHNETDDVWYECVFESRRRVYTWTMLPPADDAHDEGV